MPGLPSPPRQARGLEPVETASFQLPLRSSKLRAQSGLFNPRVLLAFVLCSVGVLLAMLSFATTPPTGTTANPDANFSTNSRVDQRARPLSDKASAAAADAGWSIVPSPNVSGASYHLLNGVTCVSASDCWAVGYYGGGQTLVLRYTANVPIPTNVASRKTHGSAGTFDINLPLTGDPGIECRTGGAAGNYRIIVTFPSAVTCNNAQVTSGTGSVSNFSVNGSGTKVTVNLTGVANAQKITVTLLDVNDGNNTGDVAARMGVLLGDTTANGSVNSSDISQTKSKSGQSVTSANFRQDVTISGSINSSDISLVKSKSGTGLP